MRSVGSFIPKSAEAASKGFTGWSLETATNNVPVSHTIYFLYLSCRVPDPDPHVFGPPGSGSISQRYEFGSGSFCQQAMIVRKALITVLCLVLDFLSLKNDVNVPTEVISRKA